MLCSESNRLIFQYDSETLWIEPWGNNALRVRATKDREMPKDDWALLPGPRPSSAAKVSVYEKEGTITNGNIKATISARGKVMMYGCDGKRILEEYARHRLDLLDPKCSALNIAAREWMAVPGRGEYHLTLRLESVDPDERIYGTLACFVASSARLNTLNRHGPIPTTLPEPERHGCRTSAS